MVDNDTTHGSDDAVSEESEAERSEASDVAIGERERPASGEADQREASEGASGKSGAAARTAEEMGLDELRTEIRTIDREIVELIAQRTYVAESIAEVKRQQGMPTTDESQEEAVMERAGENAEQFDVDANLVKAIFRLLIELNKVEQRESR
jgi:chorismate mutase